SCGLTANETTSSPVRPLLMPIQVRPPLVLLYAPPAPPAKIVDGVERAMASVYTAIGSLPAVGRCQVAPLSMLLKTPAFVAANSVEDRVGSMAISQTLKSEKP